MSSFLDSVEREYKTRDLYNVLGLKRSASEEDIKRTYRKMALKVHPDRVEREQVEEATRKFQILCKIHLVLVDKERRAVYDEMGVVDEEGGDTCLNRDWCEYWRLLFPRVTVEDMIEFEKTYKGSEEEAENMRSAYLDFEGDMDKIMDEVLCAQIEDEPRFRTMIDSWIREGSVPEFPAYSGETQQKRKRRKRRYEKEAQEAEQAADEEGLKIGDDNGLSALIRSRQNVRAKEMNNFFEQLEQKYAKKPKRQQAQQGGTSKRGKRTKGKK